MQPTDMKAQHKTDEDHPDKLRIERGDVISVMDGRYVEQNPQATVLPLYFTFNVQGQLSYIMVIICVYPYTKVC